MSLNASSQMDGIAKEWGFASRSAYSRDIPAMESFSTYIGNQFTRTEKLQTQTGNDSMKFNYNGISQFSSVRNRSSSSTLDKLGFKSSGTNLNLRYANNSILADSLFGISTISQTVLLISMALKISIKKIILPYMKINTLFRLQLLVNLFTMMSSSMNIPWIIRPHF